MSQLKSEVVCGVDEIQAAIVPLMKAFFDRFSSRQSILAEWKSTGRLVYNDDRSSLVAAVLLSSIGDTPGAANAFHDAFSSDHKGFQEYVRSVAAKMSVEL